MSITPKKKICIGCKTEQYIFSNGRCLTCARPHFKPITVKKKYTYKPKPTGEKKLFLEIWQQRPHYCTNCKVYLGNEPRTYFFAHIKPKGRFPELRLDPLNIRLLCLECHQALDHGTKEQFNSRTR